MEWWPERKLSQDFLRRAGRYTAKEISALWKEIPEEWRNLAYVFIDTTFNNIENGIRMTCLEYRVYCFALVKRARENGIDVKMPYYWFTDGVMIHPEWIVNITNGIVGFSGDESCKGCGRDDCFYRGYDWKEDKKC